ncbi:hypothetical protein NQ317_004741 [Molorchus minor]|uniref:Uncharacterized protein n=1 Tax=Molorchus minor TaxID=1323400 RepID=A0ABQ9JP98_9CUCU|nr:hypothetical protein NQ317_004741 [Molorchus minor]
MSIYAAMYFIPILVLTHAVVGDYSFPYLVVILSVISCAAHFAIKMDQSITSLIVLDPSRTPQHCHPTRPLVSPCLWNYIHNAANRTPPAWSTYYSGSSTCPFLHFHGQIYRSQ